MMWRRIVLCATAAAMPAAAQDLGRKMAPQERPVVIEGATVHPVSGPSIEGGVIWFDGGIIRGVGAAGSLELPADAQRIDGSGKHVYPGMISAVTTLGLVEIGQVRATRDEDEVGDVTPEVRAAVAVNPDSTVLPVTRSNGVLAAGVFPTGGLIPGRACVLALEGWTWEQMAVASDAGLVVNWPSKQSRRSRWSRSASDPGAARKRAMERRETIVRVFEDARAYVNARRADPTIPADIRRSAMAEVLAGNKPVFVLAQDQEQIESAVTWARDIGVRMTLVGGRDADLCATSLRRNDIPVIISGTHRLPRRRDSAYDEPFRLPLRLQEAGLRWCLASTGQFYNERNLPYQAATAVGHGLEREAALRAITLAAAEILGVGDRLGSLETGKAATLIVTNGDPLEIMTRVERAFVDGRQIDLRNKQTALFEKYREKYRQLGLWPENTGERGK